MKRSGFTRKGREPEQAAPSKIVPRPKPPRAQSVHATASEERCPHIFEEHGTHARQQCTRVLGHYGHHNCGGVRK